MSMKLMVRVLEEVELTRPQQAILLAMAENAKDDGTQCFPSIDLIAWKAGYKPRNVTDIVRELRAIGVLSVVAEATAQRPTEYAIHLDKAPRKMPFEEWQQMHGRYHDRGPYTPREARRGVQSHEIETREIAPVHSDEGCNLTGLGVQSHERGVQSHEIETREIAPEPVREPVKEPSEPGESPRDARDTPGDGADEKPKRATRLPDDFTVTDEMRAFALRLGLTDREVDFETDAFQDHFRSAPGQKGVKVDWVGTWRNWMRREAKKSGPPAATGDGYIPAVGDDGIAKLTTWLDRQSDQFGGEGWVRRSLRNLADDVPGLQPEQVKQGINIGCERIRTRLADKTQPITSPTSFAYSALKRALSEQLEVSR